MAEQMSTPGSNGDASINGGRLSLPKDKSCPFCQQTFTSSSLGRHLDLYIKEKHPKPADGVHDATEIRKLRGSITRRQPRKSVSRREDSISLGKSVATERQASDMLLNAPVHQSPSPRSGSGLMASHTSKPSQTTMLNEGTWNTTGSMHKSTVQHRDILSNRGRGDVKDSAGRIGPRNVSVSRQEMARSILVQKHKMMDALDEARAAKLALRELLGALRAAKLRIGSINLFDYDPLTLDFPALCLQCLSPPPTLHQSITPPRTPAWSVLPPEEQQYNALRAHFSEAFHDWRVSCAISNTRLGDGLSYPEPLVFTADEDGEMLQRADAEASMMENKISEHLHGAFTHWLSIPVSTRNELWTLELARNLGKKSEEITELKREKDLAQQEAMYRQLQDDEPIRPRQFEKAPTQPATTLPLSNQDMTFLGKLTQKHESAGFSVLDRDLSLDVVVKWAVGRWVDVVKQTRGIDGDGMAGQRSLSSDLQDNMDLSECLTGVSESSHAPEAITPSHGQDDDQDRTHSQIENTYGEESMATMNGVHSDPDADGDAEMDEEHGRFDNASDLPQDHHHDLSRITDPRVNGGSGECNHNEPTIQPVLRGTENHTYVGGYVRIDAS